ncbi:HEAT repeat domain-containing protein [Streptomyces sp. Qhu-G9]|uniref:HEAT repeat domain-containing protein n=1 Tax=Streptomyces sp. Qhu-G9 TaxID=3452799 RepID=UPI0022AC8C53|nr:HEAT repeat domain-containing protein [Streptomyces aurantiacus]WAU82578.1 HEAT repeat domain-containing protein [Streptomyces aurantiacus]
MAGTEMFSGQRVSEWAPPVNRMDKFVVPGDDDVLLAVVAVWSSWAGEPALLPDGRMSGRWAKPARAAWGPLLEAARQERNSRQSSRAEDVAVEAAVAAYAQRVREAFGNLDLEVLTPLSEQGEQTPVGLREVFVVPGVRGDPPPVELPRELVRRLEEAGELPPDEDLPDGAAEALQRLRQSYQAQPVEDALELLARSENRHVVLLGDPGAGKSTLARYLALTLTAGPVDTGPLAGLSGIVPLVVELRRYGAALGGRDPKFEEFLADMHDNWGLCVPEQVLKQLLEQGRAWVIFDGLDELFDPAMREDVAQRIAGFARRWPRARILVSSRVVGYRRGALQGAGFSHHMLQDLDNDRIRTFAQRWYRCSCAADKGEATRLTARLTDAVHDSRPVRELAGNPLLLTILAIIGRRQALPRDRRGVYEHAVTVLVSHWDQTAKNLQAPLTGDVSEVLDALGPRERTRILEVVAQAMQGGAAGIAGNYIHGPDLEELIAGHLALEHGLPQLTAAGAARAMVDQLRERNFILARYGGQVYGFVHRTFLEYLAATDIARRFKDDRDWTPDEFTEQIVAARAGDSAWHEVLLLLIGQLGQRDAAAAIDRILARPTQSVREQADSAVLALRALAEAASIGTLHDQSIAAINASISVLRSRMDQTATSWLTDALPALASFGRYWPGRTHYLRWFHLIGQFARVSIEPTQLACALLENDLQHSLRLAYLVHHPADRTVALKHLDKRWTDAPETRTAVMAAATHTEPYVRSTALEALAERWADLPETRTAVMAAATDTEPDVRRAALRMLGERWADLPETRTAVMAAATDTDTTVRRAALRMLGERWGDLPETRTAVMAAATDTEPDVRRAALRMLGERWGDLPETRTAVMAAATDTEPDVRRAALRMLGERWGDLPETRTAVMAAATDTDTAVRSTALEVLAERWADLPETRTAVMAAATDTEPDVRSTALHMLGERWADLPETRTAVMAAATHTEPDVRSTALEVLAERWADLPETRTAVMAAATDTEPYVRSTALEVLAERWADLPETRTAVMAAATDTEPDVRRAALRMLGERWADLPETRTAVMAAATDTDTTVRRAALEVLAERWADLPETRTAVMAAATDTEPDVRSTALEVLAERWADLPETRTAVMAAATDTEPDVRSKALEVLGQRWPDRTEAQTLLAAAAASVELDEAVRVFALATCTLHVPGWEDGSQLHQAAVTDPSSRARERVLRILALEWPNEDRTILTLRTVARKDEDEGVRNTAASLLGILAAAT